MIDLQQSEQKPETTELSEQRENLNTLKTEIPSKAGSAHVDNDNKAAPKEIIQNNNDHEHFETPRGLDSSKDDSLTLKTDRTKRIRPAGSNDTITIEISTKLEDIHTKHSGGTSRSETRGSFVVPIESLSEITNTIKFKFIRKVLLILLTQITLCSLIVGITFLPGGKVNEAIRNTPCIVIITLVLTFLCFFALICKRNNLKKVPLNYILLFTFTCSSSYSLAFLASFTESHIVLFTAIFTLIIVCGAILYAWKARNKPSRVGYFLCQIVPLAAALLIVGLSFPSLISRIGVSSAIVFIFAMHLTFDIQRLINNFESKYTLDDYILAALDIYIDIYLIFAELLKLIKSLFEL